MYRCGSCSSAYLDPRPNAETIGLAYQRYFTHNETLAFSSLTLFGKLRRLLANGDRNYRYGTKESPSSIIGFLASFFMPNARAVVDSGMRHLPKVSDRNRLLDLGCGNGTFLSRARSAGWDVVGVDFDSNAVKAACRKGLDVRLGGIEILDPSIDQFDVITLSHVIEHVHHPLDVLKACYKLLRPSGYLWVDTPNIDSEGYRMFRENWIHLDPPRHLVLFNLQSMQNALTAAGFSDMEVLPPRPLFDGVYRSCEAIIEGKDPYSGKLRKAPASLVKRVERVARCNPSRREYITIRVCKK